ncbi:class I SAM-dependent methyltransferase [Brevundimonas sp.]|uniref:class I SAM-dependent methyltransferase n=1 Tax=Brevundimonas sp. TaxID=1871086 RepID=UPI0011FC27F9|nr:class I SAM-dependent methyltransferase [Brevundimonas sp.]TAJ59732.1 MAG: class I SAM-dependent methyltransferase [Brevundimonas sp.]
MTYARAEYYETDQAVAHFVGRYSQAKERAFCRFIGRLLGTDAEVLEIGGGSGLHASMLAPMVRSYVHSDLSAAMCNHARTLGLESRQVDGLNIRAPAKTILAIELSTLRGDDAELRRRQLQEMARVADRIVISTARLGMHTMDRDDVRCLADVGFRLRHWTSWGVIPTRFWPPVAGPMVEAAASALGLGLRRVALFSR